MKFKFIFLLKFLLISNLSFAQEITFIQSKSGWFYTINNRDAQDIGVVIYEDNILNHTDQITYKDAKKILNYYLFKKTDNAYDPEIKNLKIIPKLLELHPSLLDTVSKQGEDYLFFAKTPELIDLFLDKGLLLESVNEQGRSPLHFALKNRYPERIILHLVKRGSDIDKLDAEKNFPLDLALRYPYSIKVIKALIPTQGLIQTDRLGNINFDLVKEFFLMIPSGNLESFEVSDITRNRVKWLLETYPEYIEYENFNEDKNTLLHVTVDEKTAEFLMNKYKLSPLTLNAQGNNVIHYIIAAINDHIDYETNLENDSSKILGRNVDAQKSLLVSAHIVNIYLDTIEFFIDKESGLINLQNENGSTALHIAKYSGSISFLLQLGFDMSVKDNNNQNTLHLLSAFCDDKYVIRSFKAYLKHDPVQFEKTFNETIIVKETSKKASPRSNFKLTSPVKYAQFMLEKLAFKSPANQSFTSQKALSKVRDVVDFVKSKIKK